MSSQKVFDALLVVQYRFGNQKAMGLLVKRYHKKRCRHAYWYTQDIDTAKDIVQDCWGIIIAKQKFLKDPNTFGSWAMRIVTRKSLDFLNRTKREREKAKLFEPIGDGTDETEEKEGQIKRLKKAIKALPNEQQLVLQLYYTQDYSIKEIATILKISVGTVKSRLFHARERLKLIFK